MFVCVKACVKRTPSKIVFFWCLETNLEQDSLHIFMNIMKIKLKSDRLPSISKSGGDFKFITKSCKPRVSGSRQDIFAFSVLNDRKNAWSEFLTKYSQLDIRQWNFLSIMSFHYFGFYIYSALQCKNNSIVWQWHLLGRNFCLRWLGIYIWNVLAHL